MKTKSKIIGIIFCMLILGNILPIAGADYLGIPEMNTNDIDFEESDAIVDPVGANPIAKIILIGRIKDLTFEEDPFFGNWTYFTAVRVTGISIYRYGGSRAIGLFRYKNMPLGFPMDYYQFRGILRNRFICGVFKINIEQ